MLSPTSNWTPEERAEIIAIEKAKQMDPKQLLIERVRITKVGKRDHWR